VTLILGSGHGLESLLNWLRDSVLLPESLRLDVRYENKQDFSNYEEGFFVASYLLPCNRSLLLAQVLPPTASAWQLTLWFARKGDSRYWRTFGPDGEVCGVGSATPSITKLDPTCF